MNIRGSGANTEPLRFVRSFDRRERSGSSSQRSPHDVADSNDRYSSNKSSRHNDRDRERRSDRDYERRHDRERQKHRNSRSRSRSRDSDSSRRRRRVLSNLPPPSPPRPAPLQPPSDVDQNVTIAASTALANAVASVATTSGEKKRSRWSTNKAFVPGMPTILPTDMDDTQTQIYLLKIEVEESTRKLRMNEFTNPNENRSPSPEPIYDNNGKRMNTREVRKRHELELRRHENIQSLMRLNPEYKPPADYRPPNIRLHDKVWIPQDGHPEINFVGLLIGPRGNTLKSLEMETGARIIIRGKGSVKEGKLLRRDGPLPGENEPLHAYVTGTDQDVIKAACEKIQRILDDALNQPEANNLLRQHQLRELAVLNGTLRPEDWLGGTRCSNCGSDQHKTYECAETQNFTASIICKACGSGGHLERDCLAPRQGYQAANNEELDSEYSALMAEIGGATGQKPPTSTAPASIPFRLPPQVGHPSRGLGMPPPPSRNNYYPPPPVGLHLPPPPGWQLPDTLDPTAAAAAAAAMMSNGDFSFQFDLLPPPPPPPAQFGEGTT